MEYYPYDNYETYIEYQTRRSKRSRNISRRARRKKHFDYDAKHLKELFPELKRVLCIGSRTNDEVKAFRDNGFESIGIDLHESEDVLRCDMSRMYEHEYFKDNKYDIAYMKESLEHCLDFDGLLKSIDYVGIKVIFVHIPRGIEPYQWDCFCLFKNEDVKTPQEAAEFFPNFEVAFFDDNAGRGVTKFIMKRKEDK